MAAPTPYVPSYSFTGYQTANPTRPLPGTRLDNALANAGLSTTQIIAALAKIQRSDGALQNGVVTVESLAADILTGLPRPTLWATATVYAVGDLVFSGAILGYCKIAHTSTSYATDRAAGKWEDLADFTPLEIVPASSVTFDPTGTGLTASDVQAALEEEDTRAAELIAAVSNAEIYFDAERTTYIPRAPLSHAGGTPGISGKFSDTYLTDYGVHRWTKPTISFLVGIIVEGASGGAGGGTSGPATGEPSTGPGGAGGAYTLKEFNPADVPAEVVFLSGGRGMAGGWDKTVSYPNGPDTQGWIFDVGAGGDGGHSAMLDAADWDGLGADDAARIVAFKALSLDAKIALCLLYCSPGLAAPAIDVEENVEGEGGMAYGGDINLSGNDGAGGAYWVASDIPYYPADGILGGGGACGSRVNNDGLWDTGYHGVGGVVGQLTGRGGTPKKSLGNHDGGWGSDWGGGGGGGQASTEQDSRVVPGGAGGSGGWRLKLKFVTS